VDVQVVDGGGYVLGWDISGRVGEGVGVL